MHTTPVSLLERLKTPSDQSAWESFLELYTPLLYAWTQRLGLSQNDAADLVQDILLLLLRKLPTFEYDREKRFRGWLHAVTVNQWRKLARKRQPLTASLGIESVPEPEEPDNVQAFWEEEYLQHLLSRAIELSKAEFQTSTWTAFTETFLNQKSIQEVAQQLGITTNAVHIARSRVLKFLRKQLDGLLS